MWCGNASEVFKEGRDLNAIASNMTPCAQPKQPTVADKLTTGTELSVVKPTLIALLIPDVRIC